jgi:hypothetical protein
MPTWSLVILGIVGGALIVAAVFVFAFLPELRPRAKKSSLAPPSGNVDSYPYSDPGPNG